MLKPRNAIITPNRNIWLASGIDATHIGNMIVQIINRLFGMILKNQKNNLTNAYVMMYVNSTHFECFMSKPETIHPISDVKF
jgi:hypothetical protein